MIPKAIRREHVLKAIEEIDKNGAPEHRKAKKFHLRFRGQDYSPKLILSLASRFACGRELRPSEFGGGRETNNFLERLSFKITGQEKLLPSKKKARHSDRCSDCKNAIIEFLRRAYGTVKVDHRIHVPARLGGYRTYGCYNALKRIHAALQQYRGHGDFVRLRNLHRCDAFIPSANRDVEFDESQHFTMARHIALSHYPVDLPLGFDKQEWMEYCEKTRASDRDPAFRDEQRAWYDTLRDFLPLTKGLSPTLRIRMGDVAWCSMNPEDRDDAEKFRSLLGLRRLSPVGTAPHDNKAGARIVTVAIESEGNYSFKGRQKLMKEVLTKIQKVISGDSNLVVFPAGFFHTRLELPRGLEEFTASAQRILTSLGSQDVVCCGIDGLGGRDQLAVAVNHADVLAVGRKFYPTKDDRANNVRLAEGYLAQEAGRSRIFAVGNRRFYLAVCYDVFGIRKKGLPNPDVEGIIALVHEFGPKGEVGSSDPYFAKHGFAGASKQWRCPVFGAAVFSNRAVPERWPTGVIWSEGSKSTKQWRYEDNPMKPSAEVHVRVGTEDALIRIFDLPTAGSNRAVTERR